MMKIAQNSFCRLMFHHFSITVSPLAQCHGIVVAPWTSYQLVFLPNKWYTIGKLLYHVHIASCILYSLSLHLCPLSGVMSVVCSSSNHEVTSDCSFGLQSTFQSSSQIFKSHTVFESQKVVRSST